MAKLEVPSVRDLYEAFIADYESRTGQKTPLLQIAFIRMLAWPFSGLTVLCYRYGQWIYFQQFLATCSLDALKIHGARVGLTIKDGSNTIAEVTLSGVTATDIPTGTVFVSPTSRTFKTTALTPVVDGLAVCVITSFQTGEITAVNIDDTMTLAAPLNGVPDEGLITTVTTEGADPEPTETFRARVQLRYRVQPQGGAAADYFIWGTEVDGVLDIFPYVIAPGLTSIYVVEAGSGDEREPSPTKLAEVEAYLRQSPDSAVYDRHPVQAILTVLAPIFTDYDVAITSLDASANTTQNRNDIKAAIVNHLDSRRPEIPALDYPASEASIGPAELSARTSDVLRASQNPGTFLDLVVSIGGSPISGKSLLDVGGLANLGTLTINGTVVT